MSNHLSNLHLGAVVKKGWNFIGLYRHLILGRCDRCVASKQH
jgi:hypothetical protein